ncbi:14035_t:CDS:2, partial [Cetraspora pellucida]
EIHNWLNKQAIFQVHKPSPRYIPRVSFNTIQIPNEYHQADILYMLYDKIRKITYMFCLNVADIASRYKASVPIRGIIPNIYVSQLKAEDDAMNIGGLKNVFFAKFVLNKITASLSASSSAFSQ